jgi:hypothetical protein
MTIGKLKPSGTVLIAAVALVIGLEAPAAAHQVAHKISGSDLKPNSVTGKQVKESSLAVVPEARTLPPLKWHRLVMQNGWSSVVGDRPAAYAVDAQGIVHLRGEITGGTNGTTDNVAFTLPADAAPPATHDTTLPVAAANGFLEYFTIIKGDFYPEAYDGPGEAAIQSSANLEGITFSAR